MGMQGRELASRLYLEEVCGTVETLNQRLDAGRNRMVVAIDCLGLDPQPQTPWDEAEAGLYRWLIYYQRINA